MFQLFLIAFRNLGTHRRRTLLLGGAIAGVTALLVILMGLSTGMKETLLRSATILSTGHVNVGGFYKVTAGQAAPVVTSYPKVMELVRKEIPELDYAVQRGRGWAKIVSEKSSMQVGIGGVDVKNEPGLHKVLQIREGSLDGLSESGTALLFEKQAKRLEVKVGDTITISAPTMRGTNNTVDVRVAAIAGDMGMMSDFNIYVEASTLRSLYQLREDTTGALYLYLKDVSQVPQVQARLREVLAKAGFTVMDNDPRAFWFKFDVVNREAWTGQKLDITNWEDELSFITWTLTALNGLTGVLIFVLLVIIGVGIMNTLWIAIRERTREIGTLRAIGMQRTRVVAMFLFEAMTLGALGTLVGALLGLAVCLGVTAANVSVPEVVAMFIMSERLNLVVDAGAVVGAMVFITTCTTLISLIPSFLAARLKPVTAMHHIG
ncbi:FtsX-like permease family protein [Myxococcus sp. MISCRS1]|jgi:ABC-type lipoprotein release transport system permease subunit|uniref:ABC transporter permease n=1 Tax=Myxococcus TaxID=32 RepID=UPI001CBBBEBB|nr:MULTISPECIES: FtsX-like permease family protein [unclassified Myxococcus]MBZ4397059.1 FtsX-like permease family protein [Myxococcus sp. AS-1-15]MBZ4408214.1 FtsX-like permease family protein [Myxococcus sp. XM-1-1-1]MCY0996672.1 FtsX-like permease family protein [Myxococcus sp. MISCRS1]BDT33311.1 FtsX-like permease family protein [Myxococcus sp. MH1]